MNLPAQRPASGQLRPRELVVKRRKQTGFIFTLVCLGAIGIVSYISVNRLRDAASWSQHTEEVIADLRLLQLDVADNEASGQAGLDAGTQLSQTLVRRTTSKDLAVLAGLVTDNPVQVRRLEQISHLIEHLFTAPVGETPATVPTLSMADRGAARQDQRKIRLIAAEMENTEQDLLRTRESTMQKIRQTEKQTIVGGSVLALVAVALALATIGPDFAARHANTTYAGQAGKVGRLGSWVVKLPERTLVWSDEVRAIHEVPSGFAPTLAEALNFYPEVSRATITEAFSACQRFGTPFDLELRIITALGHPVCLRVIGDAARDPKGVIRTIHGICQDVTERTRQTAVGLRQQAELRVLFDLIPAMVWFKDSENRVLRVNQRVADALGTTVEEVEGRTMDELYPSESARLSADDHEVIRSGEPRLGIVEAMAVRGVGELWVQTDKVPVRDSEGKVVGIVVMAQDVTARRQAEVDLKHDQSLLRMAGRLTRLGAWEIEWPGRIVRWSDETCAIYRVRAGLAPTFEEMLTFFTPESHRKIRDAIEACGRRAVPFDVELQLASTEGQSSWVRAVGESRRAANGTIDRVQGAFQDITVLKASEQSLRLLNSAVLQSAESILITEAQLDLPGPRIVFVNPAFTLMTGYTAGEALGQTPRFLQGPRTSRSVLDRLRRNLEQGNVFQGNAVNYRKDGTEFTIDWRITPIRDLAGKTTHFVAIQRDISDHLREVEALRKSEEQFRQVVENIREVFWIRDLAENAMVYISPAYEVIWGRSCASLYADQASWLESVHPDDRVRVAQAQVAGHTGRDYDETFRILRPDATVRWIHSRAFPVEVSAGEASRLVGISEDITKYRELEEQFRQGQKMEAIGTLAGGIAHDFNNILGAISGYAELSQIKLKENPEVRSYLGAVLKASNRAADLVRQILMFSRQQPLERKVIRLNCVVIECLDLLRAILPATIVFETSLSIEAPTILADATQVHQLLMNLGTNAWHAMKDSPGRLNVRLERFLVSEEFAAAHPRLRPGTYARISFEDTGVGMDRVTIGRIFEPFFTTKPLGQGTGIGLAVVHGIMESHGGAITVSSEPGKGSLFRLYFPAHASDEPEVPPAAGSLPRGHGERILVVDDEEALALLSRDTLTALGYEVEFTIRPTVALEMVRTDPKRFALVISDQTMPEMTGLILAEHLRTLRPGLPFILTSGYSLDLTPRRLAEAGIDQVLPKPMGLHALATAVHRRLLLPGAPG